VRLPKQIFGVPVKSKFFSPLTCANLSLINVDMDTQQPRALSHDEKKAAEAAYHGKPFHPSWSQSARAVYDGVMKARGFTPESHDYSETDEVVGETRGAAEGLFEEALNSPSSEVENEEYSSQSSEPAAHQITSRQEAIDSGLLIDVSKNAKGVGFNLAVGITKSLWSRSISSVSESEPSEGETRIRDMLLAVRLRLASLETPTPWVEVPVLFPSQHGESTAKVFPIYALFHKDPVAEECLTLIHPKELSSIRPSSHSSSEEGPSSSDLA